MKLKILKNKKLSFVAAMLSLFGLGVALYLVADSNSYYDSGAAEAVTLVAAGLITWFLFSLPIIILVIYQVIFKSGKSRK